MLFPAAAVDDGWVEDNTDAAVAVTSVEIETELESHGEFVAEEG